ncbi:MAG TPA: hypothetical protein VGM78_05120 [Ilumatobacteraceae bacterium]|jgi:DNA-directed RNA polymerase specialized sigma24 family protein
MDTRADLHRLLDNLLSDDPRTALIAFRQLSTDELPWLEQRTVALARRHGWNWATIARLLGRTRQSVHARFHNARLAVRPDPDLARHRQEAEFAGIREQVRRSSDDDPVAW